MTEAHLDAFDAIGVALKGPITIPGGLAGTVQARGRTFTSANQAMRKLFGLFANVRPASNYKVTSKKCYCSFSTSDV